MFFNGPQSDYLPVSEVFELSIGHIGDGLYVPISTENEAPPRVTFA